MTTRNPAVAGAFYPDDPSTLGAMVRGFLDDADKASDGLPKALITPHAGYVYSGPIAASAYRQLEAIRDTIRRVVLLGPSHRVYLDGMAFPSVDAFATPLGEVSLDRGAIEQALGLPRTCVMDEAHLFEHSLEVQLPFLQSVLDEFRLVPFVVGQCEPEPVAAVLESLWGGTETLIVVSSDLSHYLPYDLAVTRDAQTSDNIVACSSALAGEDACGAHAINGLMQVVRSHELQVRALDVRNSGDTAGTRGQVVGYGAYAIG